MGMQIHSYFIIVILCNVIVYRSVLLISSCHSCSPLIIIFISVKHGWLHKLRNSAVACGHIIARTTYCEINTVVIYKCMYRHTNLPVCFFLFYKLKTQLGDILHPNDLNVMILQQICHSASSTLHPLSVQRESLPPVSDRELCCPGNPASLSQ